MVADAADGEGTLAQALCSLDSGAASGRGIGASSSGDLGAWSTNADENIVVAAGASSGVVSRTGTGERGVTKGESAAVSESSVSVKSSNLFRKS